MPNVYVNPDNITFQKDRNNEIFVDKSGLIRHTNALLGSGSRGIVVTRPRRFGKTMALSMLNAYYSRGCDSRDLFRGLVIEEDPSFEQHLNRHNVIRLDIRGLYLGAKQDRQLADFSACLSKKVLSELSRLFPDGLWERGNSLADNLLSLHRVHGVSFLFLVDEWDAIYRDEGDNEALSRNYTSFLEDLFTGPDAAAYTDLVYLTGILPLPKQLSCSGLGSFLESTMAVPGGLAECFGFTEAEVASLCERYAVPPRELESWYGGYPSGSRGSLFCPFSVDSALTMGDIDCCWPRTGPDTELLAVLSDSRPEFQRAVRDLRDGRPVPVDGKRKIDFRDLTDLEDALVALVHLGFLAWQPGAGVFLPNREITWNFLTALKDASRRAGREWIPHP